MNDTVRKLQSLLTDDLDIYTVVVLAKRDLEQNDVYSAMLRLKVDADKLRMHNRELYELVMRY